MRNSCLICTRDFKRGVFCVLALCSLVGCRPAQGQWAEPIEIFRNTEVNPALSGQSLVVADGDIYVAAMQLVWREPDSRSVKPDEIYVEHWSNGNRKEIINVSQSTDFSINPSILFKQNIHLLWGERQYNPNASLHEAFSPTKLMYTNIKNGRWTEPSLIYQVDSTYIPGVDTTIIRSFYAPVNAAVDNDGAVHVIIHDYSDGIVYLNLTDGQSSSALKISDGLMPDLTIGPDGTVYVTYIEAQPPRQGVRDINSVFFMKSVDGDVWSDTVRVSFSGTKPAGFPEILTAPGGRVHIVWQKYPNKNGTAGAPELWHSVSDDEGDTWSNPNVIEVTGSRTTLGFDAAVDRFGRIHVVFRARYGFSDPNGLLYETVWSCDRWSEPSRILDLDSLTYGHSIAIDKDRLYLVWQEREPPGTGEEFGDFIDYYSARPIGPKGCWNPPGSVPETGIHLHQNNPNPATDLTTIYYALAEPGDVTFAIYDMLGRLVVWKNLGPRPKGGGSIPFDTTGLASGIYFYMLRSGNESETRKMLVIR